MVLVAQEVNDELTVLEISKMLERQVKQVNEFEEIVKKARLFSFLDGLYYHLDHDLGER